MNRLGITGTRNPLTIFQLMNLSNLLRHYKSLGFNEMHHGDCVGADEEAVKYAAPLGYTVVCHPPEKDSLRAFTKFDEIREEKEYLSRNVEIVKEAQLGIALPDGWRPKPRSGTWHTINKMKEAKVPHFIIAPEVMWFIL